MNFRHRIHRANTVPGGDPEPGGGLPVDSPDNSDGTDTDPANRTSTDSDPDVTTADQSRFSDDQRREWRRWIVETFCTADYGVVPVDHLVDELLNREPEAVARSTVRAALIERLLPQLDRESVLEYDADRELMINYGN